MLSLFSSVSVHRNEAFNNEHFFYATHEPLELNAVLNGVRQYWDLFCNE